MSGEMSETIFVVNQIGSGCYGFPSEPQIDKYGNWCGYGWFRLSESYMPPPGECWEYRLTRKGDIDTDGDPIGWKIVGIGKDGSVLCEKGNGQRRRYSFGDGAKEQPSGEAWEFCQRLVDMVGAEGPEDVQGMLDKVNAELHRLKQNIDSMSANLADKEGFLNSAGDEIERLTKERDEAVTELRDKLERPEMPECVRELLDAVCLEVPGLFAQKIAAVRDHYAPPAGQPDRRGLQMRYRVLKADGSPADPRAKYFVLRLDWDGRDKEHVAACRKAAEAYILNAPDHMRQFSRELAEWVDLWPAGHEWQPVDDANPITAADVGRKVAFRHGGIGAVSEYRHHVPWAIRVDDIGFHASGPRIRGKISQHDITHILRPVAQPFVFGGKMRLTDLIEKLVAIERTTDPMAQVEMVDENGVRSGFEVKTEVVFAAKVPVTVLLVAEGCKDA